jgi:hypothetical protein
MLIKQNLEKVRVVLRAEPERKGAPLCDLNFGFTA